MRVLGADDLVLCSGTVRRAALPDTLRAAATAGFDGVSLYYDEYRSARADGWSDASIRTLLEDCGLLVAELDGVMRWLPDDDTGPAAAEYVDVAAALGARSVTVLESRGRRIGEGLSIDAAGEAFASVCDLAATAGMLAHLEYFRSSGIDRSATAAAIARRAGRPNGGVLCDLWHHVRGPDAGRPRFDDVPVLAVQVSDVAAVRAPDVRREMIHGRLLPGEGSADLVGLLRALRASGCDAPIEVEVYSEALAALEPDDAAARARAAAVTVLEAAGLR